MSTSVDSRLGASRASSRSTSERAACGVVRFGPRSLSTKTPSTPRSPIVRIAWPASCVPYAAAPPGCRTQATRDGPLEARETQLGGDRGEDLVEALLLGRLDDDRRVAREDERLELVHRPRERSRLRGRRHGSHPSRCRRPRPRS